MSNWIMPPEGSAIFRLRLRRGKLTRCELLEARESQRGLAGAKSVSQVLQAQPSARLGWTPEPITPAFTYMDLVTYQ